MSTETEMAEGGDRLLGDMLEVVRFTERVSAKLHRVLDETKIYQVVREEFDKSDRYTVGIMLLDDEGTSLKVTEVSLAPSRLQVLEKASGLQLKEFNITLSKSTICRQVVEEGKTVHTNIGDLIREFLPRPVAYLISKTMGYDKQSSILTPLHRHGKVIGILAMSCAELCEYLIHSVENLALHISTALELVDEYNQRKEAVQALKRYHDHLGELVEERTAELKALNEKLLEEITERKQAGEALQKERDKAQKYLDIAGVMLVAIDVNQKVTLINKRGCEVLGYSEEEVIGKNWFDTFLPERVRKEVKTIFDKLMAGEIKPAEYFENPILNKRGEERIIAWHNIVLTGEGGKIGGTLSSGEDITERKKAGEALRASREKLQKMFESVTDGISVVDLNGVIIETNPRTVEMHGFASKDELLGKNASELIAPRDRQRIAANMRRAIKEGTIRGVEYTLLRADGTEFPGELSTSILKDAAGNWVGHITVARDITNRKRAEEAIRESEERFRSIVENSQAGIMILDNAYRFVYVNDELCRISGYSRDEIMGQDFRQFLGEESKELVAERYIRRQRGEGIPARYEFDIIRKDGQKRRVEISSAVIKDPAGAVRTVAQLLDITERKQAEEALQAEKNKLQSVVDAMEYSLTIQDRDYNIVYQNEPSRMASGEHIGEKCYRAYEGKERICEGCPVEKAFKDGKSHTSERRTVAPSGKVTFWENTASPIRDAGGKIVACVELARDITKRKQAEEALQAEKNKLQSLIDAMEDGITIQDMEYNIIYQNEALRVNYGDRLGEKCYRVYEGRERICEGCPVRKAFKDGKSHTSERRAVLPSGEGAFGENTANPIRDAEGKIVSCLEIVRNITERKQAEEQLRESQKFSSSLLASSPNPIIVVNLDTSMRYVNPAFEKLTGFSLEEIVGRKAPYPWWPEGKRERILASFKDAIKHGGRRTERNFQKKNGERFWVAVNSAPVMEKGKAVYLIINWLDITERKQAEGATGRRV
jgi:PAS domain S-box-containing protein